VTALIHPDARLVDAATAIELRGSALRNAVADAAAAFDALPAGAVFARTPIAVDAIVRYLGAWEAGRAVALLDPGLSGDALTDLVTRFRPAVVLGPMDGANGVPGVVDGYAVREDRLLGPIWVQTGEAAAVHKGLGILLATSGSTGNPKLVRLARTGVVANATAIATALSLTPADLAPTSLQLYYSYGMSVLHSHLTVGAGVLVHDADLLQREFWTALDRHGATSLAGVPYQYEMLKRLRFSPADHPALRTLTQAGGRMRTEMVSDFHQRMAAVGGRLYVMYGQTEAGPRITTLPAEALPEKLGSVGPALPGGRLSILVDGEEATEPGAVGEIVYRGPNVMMGYGSSAADLARGDDLGGVLRTGDRGYLDADGYLFHVGRSSRFAKAFGVRLNLDDIEAMVATVHAPVAAVSGDDQVVVFAEGADQETLRTITKTLAERLRLHRTGIDARAIDALPRLGNGKTDYPALDGLR
jgi:acyl-coenzyme A synthetase/AMP-(fatty) acid ligase